MMKSLKKTGFITLIVFCSILNITMIIGTIYYTSKYKEFCTIVYNSNGGTIIENQIVRSGSKIEFPENPTKLGFDFIGWELNGEVIDNNAVIEKNITLVAKWQAEKIITYTVNFYNEDGSLFTKQKVKSNEHVHKPTAPEKYGYKFAYWSHNNEEFDFSKIIYEDINLFAVFIESDEIIPPIIDEGYDEEILDDDYQIKE